MSESGAEAKTLIIFVHGAGQSPQVFADQVTALPPRFRAAAPWVFGLRPGREDRFTLHHAADDLSRTCDLQGAERAVVCGIGLGARIALEFGVRHNDRLAELIMAALPLPLPWLFRATGTLAARMIPRSVYLNQNVDKAKVIEATKQVGSLGLPPASTRIEQRTLLLYGSRDSAGRASAARVQPYTPNSITQEIDGAGTQPHLEAPQAFNEAIYSFLA